MAPRTKAAEKEPVAVWSPGLVRRLQRRSSEEACTPLFDPRRLNSKLEAAPGSPALTFSTAAAYQLVMREAAFSAATCAVQDKAAAAARAGQSLRVTHQLSTRLSSASSLVTFHTEPPSTPASSADPRVLSPGALLLLSWRPAPSASGRGGTAPEELQLLLRVCASDDELVACQAFPTCSLHGAQACLTAPGKPTTAEPCCQAGSICREYVAGSSCTLTPAGDTHHLEHMLAAIERLASSPLLPCLMNPQAGPEDGRSSTHTGSPVRLLSWRTADRLPALAAAVGVQRAVMAAAWAHSNEAALRHALTAQRTLPEGQGTRRRPAASLMQDMLPQPADRPRQLLVFSKQADMDDFISAFHMQGLTASGLGSASGADDAACWQPGLSLEVVTITRSLYSSSASPEVELHSKVGALLCAAGSAGAGAAPHAAEAVSRQLANVQGQLDAAIECALRRQRTCDSLRLVLAAAQEHATSNHRLAASTSSLAAAETELAASLTTAVSLLEELSAVRDADRLARTAASAVRQARKSSKAGLTWAAALARQQQLLEAWAQSSMPPPLTPQQQEARGQVLRAHAACDVLLLSKQEDVLRTLVAGVLQQADIVCCCAADAACWELADEAAPVFACVMVAGADGVAEVELLPPLSLGARSLLLFGRQPPAPHASAAAARGRRGQVGAPEPALARDSLFQRLWKAGAPIQFMDVERAGGDPAAGSDASKAGDAEPDTAGKPPRAGRRPGSATTLSTQIGKSAH